MQNILLTIQIVLSILLTVIILMQSQGTGLGRGSGIAFTKRGLENLIFKFTFVLTALFLVISILGITL
jgi:protein translocase SecG subunit